MKQEEINKKYDYKQIKIIHGVLHDIYSDKPTDTSKLLRFSTFHPNVKVNAKKSLVGKILKSKKQESIQISKTTAHLGLLFINCFPKYSDSENWSYQDAVYRGSKRLKAFQEKYDLQNLWNGEHYNLLILCFGEEIAKYVKAAWYKVSDLMYQTGYSRRSFRRPNDETTRNILQINLMISLLNHDTCHPFTIGEKVKYNTDGYYSKANLLLATAVDNNDEKLYTLCTDILQGKAEIGDVSRLIIKGLLLSNKPEAWQQVGNLLLAAQRQEGLRQTILEALDETSIGAFQYIIKLVNEHNLSRFSSVVRSMDVWAGFGWDAEKQSTIKRFFQLAETHLVTPGLLEKSIKSKDNAEVYMALWGQGAHDVDACYPYLKELYKNGSVEKKILALYFVNQANIDQWDKEFAYLALAEEKQELHYWAVKLFNKVSKLHEDASLYTTFETMLENFPKKDITFTGKVFSWTHFTFSKASISRLLINLTDTENEDELDRLLKHYNDFPLESREEIAGIILHNFSSWGREEVTEKPTQKQRDFALKVLSDRSSIVRSRAMKALTNAEIDEKEIIIFEDFLTRKSSEFRQFVLEMIEKRDESQILQSAKRLINKTNVEQRLAGLDILNHLYVKDSCTAEVKALANEFKERARIGKKEQILLDNLLQEKAVEYNADNGYGLYNPSSKTVLELLKEPTSGEFIDKFVKGKQPFGFSMPVAKIEEKLKNLKKLFLENKDYEYEVVYYNGTAETVLLSNEFTTIKRFEEEDNPTPQQVFENYPLHEKWNFWYQASKLTPYDLFLINFSDNKSRDQKVLEKNYPKTYKNVSNLLPEVKIPLVFDTDGYRRYNEPIPKIISALQQLYPYNNKKAFFLNALPYLYSKIDLTEASKLATVKDKWGYKRYYIITHLDAIQRFNHALNQFLDTFSDDEFAQYWQYIMLLFTNVAKHEDYSLQPHSKEYLRAYTQKLCTRDELMHRLMQPDAIELFTQEYKNKNHWQFKIQKSIVEKFPFVFELIEECKERILEVELRRGDSSTPVTHLAQAIYRVKGVDYLIKILNGLGKDTLNRGYIYHYGGSDYSKKEILSTLLKRCFPAQEITQAEFNTKIKEANFTEKRLIEVALYAQQWLPFIEKYLNWKGLSSAVWWLHAHTNAYHSAETETEIGRFSKVDIKEFSDGAVDFDWFQEAHKTIGKARWKILYNAAKYISDGTGHSRAKLYADVMTGETKIREVTKRVKEKRNQDYLRVYGLVPLSKKTPEKDVLNRYNYLLQFKKESKQFGSQRQASEGLAVKIAMENLARTAGYPDPIRLTWAMETEEAKTILQKAATLTFDDVTIQIEVDDLGKSSIVVKRKDKVLKAIPAKLRKEKQVVELKDLHKRLKDQYSRSRKSLEEAMVRGDVFQAKEIKTLMQHPVIAPMLQNLVFVSENDIGFYKDETLVTPEGDTIPLGDAIRIAHCTDLYNSKGWASYQRYCFDNELVQPFKQIFRELYVPTPDELKEKTISRRYAGHQVQPKKTVALLKTRGWIVDYEEGLQKVFHKQGVIAKMYAMADWFSPADVESPTLETIEFLDRKTYKLIPFEKINRLLFSEVMRDIDLVVSVAHVGGVDPEASQSSIEMRTVIISETLRLFKLSNVSIKTNHAIIKGERGEYSVHLGSGVTHFNGKYISVLPVHSQHRGRLFLPFVDEDPRSAEIMSKILFFAKDKEIKDPTVLEQLK